MNRIPSSLTPAEWHVMEYLWQHGTSTGRDATDYLSTRVGWSRSTTLTMLRRMSEKGIIICSEANGTKVYTPNMRQEDATIRETQSFLDRIYHGSVSMMLSTFTKSQTLSDSEIAQLHAILDQAKEAQEND